MSKLSLILVCIGVLAVNVGALSEEEWSDINRSALPLLVQCGKEYNVNEETIKASQASSTTDGLNPCLLSCFLQRIGVMDKKGIFDMEALKKTSKKYIKDQEELNRFISIGNKCLPVNDVAVNDSNKRCERAKLYLDCLLGSK